MSWLRTKTVVAVVVALLLSGLPASAQIAYVAGSGVDGGNATGTSLPSFNVAAGTNPDRSIVVCAIGDLTSGGNDDLTATIGGVTAPIAAQVNTNINRFLYMFTRQGVGTGNVPVVVSAGSSHFIAAVAAAYDGVDSGSEPHAIDTDAQTTTSTTSGTVTANAGSWLKGCVYKNFTGDGPTAAAGSVERIEDVGFTFLALYDSNGTVSGSSTLTINYDAFMGTGTIGSVVAAFDDAGGGGAPACRRLISLLGVAAC
jgi:hypothetical protein